MGFTGNFETLPISEVLSLLMTSQKTGVLNCNYENYLYKYYFYNGMLVKIESKEQRLLFGEILIRKNLVKRQDLSYALQLQKDLGKFTGEILVDLNMLDNKHILGVLGFQLEENMFRIVEWGEGRFVFEEIAPKNFEQPNQYPFSKIDFNHFLNQFREKIKEYKGLADQLPSDSSKMSLFVPISDLPPDMIENSDIMEIIQLSDGSRALSSIRQLCTFGTLKAQRLIFSLYLKDILKAVSSGGKIKSKKIYDTLDQEVKGMEELLRKIFIPTFQEIHQAFNEKLGPKSEKIISGIIQDTIKKYSELFNNIDIINLEEIDLARIFANVNPHKDASWFHTVFSMLCDISKFSIRKMSGILGKVKVKNIMENLEQRIDLNLEEEKALTKKYTLRRDFERHLSSILLKK